MWLCVFHVYGGSACVRSVLTQNVHAGERRGNQPVPVKSCFGGLAAYKVSSPTSKIGLFGVLIKRRRHEALIRSPARLQISSIGDCRYSGSDCEHVLFNKCIRDHGHKCVHCCSFAEETECAGHACHFSQCSFAVTKRPHSTDRYVWPGEYSSTRRSRHTMTTPSRECANQHVIDKLVIGLVRVPSHRTWYSNYRYRQADSYKAKHGTPCVNSDLRIKFDKI